MVQQNDEREYTSEAVSDNAAWTSYYWMSLSSASSRCKYSDQVAQRDDVHLFHQQSDI